MQSLGDSTSQANGYFLHMVTNLSLSLHFVEDTQNVNRHRKIPKRMHVLRRHLLNAAKLKEANKTLLRQCKQGVALTGCNTTGPLCSADRPHAVSGSITDDNRRWRQMPASKTIPAH